MNRRALNAAIRMLLIGTTAFLFLFDAPTLIARATPGVIAVPQDLYTIQQAIDEARPGDTIEITGGTYDETLQITKNVHLRAVPGATVVVVARPEDAHAIDMRGVAGASIEGLTVRGGRTGIRVIDSRDVRLANDTLTGYARYGLGIARSGAVVVEGNHLTSGPGGSAIGVAGQTEAVIRGNTIDGSPIVGVGIAGGSVVAMEDNRITGAKAVGGNYGIGLQVSTSAAVTLTRNTIADNEGGGAELLGVDAYLSGNSFMGNGDQGLLVKQGSSVVSDGDTFAGAHPGPKSGQGEGVVVRGRSRLSAAGGAITGNRGAGLWVSENSSLRLSGSRVDDNGLDGLSLESGSTGEVDSTSFARDGRHGVNVFDGAVLTLDGAAVTGTREASGLSRGIELSKGSRASVISSTVSGSGQLGIAVFDSSFLGLADSTVDRNGSRGVTVERRSRAVVRRSTLSGQDEAGASALTGSQLSIWDSSIAGNGKWGLYVDRDAQGTGGGNRFSDNGTDLFGLMPAAARLAVGTTVSSTLVLRASDDFPLPQTVRVYAGDQLTATLDQPNLAVAVAPGRYRLGVTVRGALREVPWGEVEVGGGEQVVQVQSGIRLEPATAEPGRLGPVAWRVYDAASGRAIQDVDEGIDSTPLPPGRYRVVLLTGRPDPAEISVGPAGGVEVRADRVTAVPVDPTAVLAGLRLRIEPVPGHADAVRVTPGISSTRQRVRLSLFGPDAQTRYYAAGWSANAPAPAVVADLLGSGEVRLPADLPAGDHLAILERFAADGATLIGGDFAPLLVAAGGSRPALALDVPPFAAPGEPFALAVRAAATQNVRADLFVSVTQAGGAYWWVPGGKDPVALADSTAKAPLVRNTTLGAGSTPLFDWTLPPELAGKGRLDFHAALTVPYSDTVIARADATLTSCLSRVAFSGRLSLGAAPAVSPTVTIDRIGPRAFRRTVTGAPDGAFGFSDVPAGLYSVDSAATDAPGGFYASHDLLEIGCDGLSGWTRTLPLVSGPLQAEATRPDAADVSEPGASRDLADFLNLVDFRSFEGVGSPALPQAAACGEGCPCGRLPICVRSGHPQGWISSLNDVSGDKLAGNWKGIDMLHALGAEQQLADALSKTYSCLDVIPTDSKMLQFLAAGIQRKQQLQDEMAAAEKSGDPARVKAVQAEIDACNRDNVLSIEQLMLETQSCMASVTMSGAAGGLFRFPHISAHVQAGSPLESENAHDSTQSVTVTGKSWAEELADDIVGSIGQAVGTLFCSCRVTDWYCSNERYPENPFAPGAHVDTVCQYTISCCGEPPATWDVHSAVPGFRGVAEHGHKVEQACCSDFARERPDFDQEAPLFCPGGWTLMARDFDCDGIPNLQDPSPLPPD